MKFRVITEYTNVDQDWVEDFAAMLRRQPQIPSNVPEDLLENDKATYERHDGNPGLDITTFEVVRDE